MEGFVSWTMVLPTVQEESGIRIDFIFSFTPYESQAITRANRVELSGQEIAFASPEDLIIHKIFAGRPRDLEDIRSVLLRNSSMDFEYIRWWLQEFDASGGGGEYLKIFEDLLGEIGNRSAGENKSLYFNEKRKVQNPELSSADRKK